MEPWEYLAKRLEHQERLKAQQLGLLKDMQQAYKKVLPAVLAALSGVLGLVCFGVASQETRTETSGFLFNRETTITAVPMSTRISWLFAGIILLGIALFLAFVLIKQANRKTGLRKYPPILVGREAIPLQQISAITGQNMQRVCEDLEIMIASGMIDDFYVDYELGQVVSKKYVPKTSSKTVVTCSGCGGSNELIIGITRTCMFCGQPLTYGKTSGSNSGTATDEMT